MGVGVQSSNCRLRTVWTPEMDRYFIDLMLEQVGQENRRDDHLFSKRAWNYMTTMFNARFNSRYKKDVLKNRHKILRNLYRALENVLEQKGFRWDESKQMVTADERVWDEYIQAHPDARPFRMKTIPYYSDLFEIYGMVDIGRKGTIFSRQKLSRNGNMSRGNAGSLLEGEKVGRTSEDDEKLCSALAYSPNFGDDMVGPGCVSEMARESLYDIMIAEDYDISNETFQFLSDVGSTIGARTRTYWQPPMDRYFIDLMIDQVNKTNHVDGLLSKQAWREMISLFNAKFRFNYGVDILKNRYKSLRRQHNVMRNLLESDGFAWDDARQMVIADDHVWQNYIKDHRNVRQYMTRPVPYFEGLCLIFRELNSDEKDTISSHRNLDILDEGPEINFVIVDESVTSYDQFCMETEFSLSNFDITATKETTKRHLEIPTATISSKKLRIENKGVINTIHDEKKNDENLNVVPIELVVTEIQALPDMDEELVLDACDFLEDEKRAKTFLALDVKLRKKWLLRKLRPSNLHN